MTRHDADAWMAIFALAFAAWCFNAAAQLRQADREQTIEILELRAVDQQGRQLTDQLKHHAP